ncbi:MAG: glycosyltransferase family 4 protein [Lachnospiraceae bacterium]|nr:glycosyltransferase family 4 protein [Lachnospiraceae bacterium]
MTTERKRIGLFVTGEPYMGGKWQYIGFLLDALYSLREKYEIFIIHLYNEPQWEDVCLLYGFREAAIAKTGFGPFNIQHGIDALKCDLILDSIPNWTCGIVDTPVVSIVHDLMHKYEHFSELSSVQTERERLYRCIAKHAFAIFVDSPLGKQQFVECYGNIMRGTIFEMPFRVPDYLLNAIGCPVRSGRGSYIFYPAQFWEHKNHEGLVRAAHKLREEEGLLIKLVFVGSEKNNYERIISLINELRMESQVEIKGYVTESEMCELYQGARAMMMASFLGPTNIPPLEAMATGCPCAVADVYAMPWQIGDAGLRFNPRSVDSIAVVMKRLWTDDVLCDTLSKRGIERVNAYFSKEAFEKRFAEAISVAIKNVSLYKNHKIKKVMGNFIILGRSIFKEFFKWS